MTQLTSVITWLLISAFSFYVLGRAQNPRERSGRKLVGIGALVVAAVVAIPQTDQGLDFGDVIAVVGMVFAAAVLLLGLYRAFPAQWRRRPPSA